MHYLCEKAGINPGKIFWRIVFISLFAFVCFARTCKLDDFFFNNTANDVGQDKQNHHCDEDAQKPQWVIVGYEILEIEIFYQIFQCIHIHPQVPLWFETSAGRP